MASSADDIIAKLAAQAAGSKATATATEQLDAAIKAEQAALAGLGGSLDAARAKLAALQAVEEPSIQAIYKQRDAIKALEAAEASRAAKAAKLSNARGGIAAMEAQAAAAKKAAEDAATGAGAAFTKLGGDMQSMLGKATSVGGVIGKLQGLLGTLGPEGQAAAAALGIATMAITGLFDALSSGMSIAIEATEKINAFRSVLDALGGGAAGGAAALKVIQDLGKSLPFATSQIKEWAKSLMSAGFQGAGLKSAIEAVAAATAIMGAEGGAAAEKMLKTLQEGGKAAADMMKQIQAGGRKSATLLADMGLQSHDLAQAMGMTDAQFKSAHLSAEQMQKAIEGALKKKGAGPLADLAMTFPVLIQKMREGFFSLFSKLGPSVKPFMQAVKDLFSLFNKGGAGIKFLQPIITAVFTTLFSWATKAVGAIRGIVTWLMASGKAGGMFSGVIATLKAGWASLKGIWATLVSVLTPVFGALKAIFSNAMVLKGIGTMIKIIAAIFVGLVTTIATVAAVFVAVAAVVVGALGAIWGAISYVEGVIADFVGGAIDALGGLGAGAGDAASNFVSGLADGIAAGAGAIMAAVTGLASGALGAFKSAMGIASPSKVMMQMGGHMASGVAEGVDDGAPKAQAATAALVDPKALKVGKAGAGGASKVVNVTGPFYGTQTKEQIRAIWYEVLEEEGGGGPAPVMG